MKGFPVELWAWLYAVEQNDSGKPVPRRARGAWDTRKLSRAKSDVRYVRVDEYERLREVMLETAGRLHQLASERSGLSPRDMRELARFLLEAANKIDTMEGK